ncbi:GNAT family N-acetyltransferase [Kitasatospora sp. RG8]|uniref:GNAT family N-acetyltransferase n=1 Tax=Kitasatospora sp. RG8 TaxID=2820815 RepID=UPI001AE07594|nr:GNAT family N-acetyltransferase [Kitasatospora sp. RG8]MBP0450602.1 GNAT family N-acetyltransferase [Kitasatospora sp. RG8]
MSAVPDLPPTAEALIADGTTVEIRPIAPSDRAAVLDLHANRMSEESRRLRFFGASRRAPELAAERLCGPVRPGLLALGAWAGPELVGEADCEVVDDPACAELALAVADEWHRRGVATLLLEHLVHAARGRDARVFEADTLAGNRAVHRVFAPGVELLAGVVQDRVFGPLVVLGMGGTAADVLADRAARLAPLTEHDLTAMATELHGAPLLLGHQGASPADLAAVRDVLARLSRLAADLPQLVEADLNPLIARPGGAVCVDARVRLEPRPSFDPYLRRLRRPAAAQEA